MSKNNILQELRKQLKKENSAQLNVNGIDVFVSVSTIRKFCIIKLERIIEYKNPQKAKQIVNIINNTQDSFEYEINDNKLKLKTNMWIDTNPTYKALEEIINEMVSNTESINRLLKQAQEDEN